MTHRHQRTEFCPYYFSCEVPPSGIVSSNLRRESKNKLKQTAEHMHFPITVVSLLLQTLLTVAFINFFGGLFCPELWSPSGMNGIEQVHGGEVGKDRARNDWQ